MNQNYNQNHDHNEANNRLRYYRNSMKADGQLGVSPLAKTIEQMLNERKEWKKNVLKHCIDNANSMLDDYLVEDEKAFASSIDNEDFESMSDEEFIRLLLELERDILRLDIYNDDRYDTLTSDKEILSMVKHGKSANSAKQYISDLIKRKEERAMKELKKDNGWKLEVKVREDEDVFQYDIYPLEPGKLYIIKNLTTASDGSILVDVYSPESMGLDRSKVNINIFRILPTNKKYVWRIMKFDPSAQVKIDMNVMIIEAYYCAVNQNLVTISDIVDGRERTEIITSDSSIFISGKGDVYAVLESDKDKQDGILKNIKSKMMPSDFENMAAQSFSNANGVPYMPTFPGITVPSMPGMSGFYGMSTYPNTPPVFGMSMGGYHEMPIPQHEMPIPQWPNPSTPKKETKDISIEDDLGFLNKSDEE